MIVDKKPVEEEPKVPTITDMPDATITDMPEYKVTLDKGYYHGVYAVLHFNKGNRVSSN